MKKNILMYLYILLIAGATFLLVPVFKVMGSTNFLEDNREVFEANDYDLMSGTTLSFRNNGTSSYIKKEALFSQAYESKNEFGKVLYKFSLDIYAATEKKGSKYQDGFFLLVKDIHIDHPNIILDEDGRNLIRFVMEFDKPVIYKDKELKSSEDIFVPLYDGKSGILFFDQSLLKNNDGFVEVKKMTLSVVTNQEVSIDLLNLYNYDLDPEIKEDMFDESHNRDIKNVSSTNINSFKKYGADGLNYSGDFYYNDQLRKTYRTKYNYFPIFIVVWVLVVLIVTYLLFFHKYVASLLKQRKENDRMDIEKLKQNIKMEEKK